MMFLESILKDMHLLKEDASVDSINNAIDNMRPAVITYKNEYGKVSSGKRKIYPIAYGISTAGNPVVRAFEPSGDTSSEVPAWKLFLLSNIDTWETLEDDSFKNVSLVGINRSGKDKQMSTLYNVSPLSDSAKKWKNDEPVIKSTPITKSDVDAGGPLSAEEMVNTDIYTSSSEKTIDNNAGKSYNLNKNPEYQKISAPEATEPIRQSQIDPLGTEASIADDNQENEINLPSDSPVSKEEVEQNDENQNELTNVYNDMVNRWDKKEETEINKI